MPRPRSTVRSLDARSDFTSFVLDYFFIGTPPVAASFGSLATQLEWETNPVVLSAGVDPDHAFLLGGETSAGVRAEDRFPFPGEPEHHP